MFRPARFPLIALSLIASSGAFQYNVLYTFRTQPRLSEPNRPDTAWYFSDNSSNGTYPRTNTMMREGGFSDLVPDPSDATGHTFWTIQDRGVAVAYEPEASDSAFKVFAFPGHHQKLLRVRVQGDSVETLARDSIGGLDTGFTTGLPSSRVLSGERALRMRLDSAVVDSSPGNRVAASPNGYDFEGLARAPGGDFFLADEFGPRIVRVDATTRRITQEWRPGAGLPVVLARRRPNRGFESICVTPAGNVVAMLQGGLYNTASGNKSRARDSTRVLRMLWLNPQSGAVKEYVYLADLKGGNRLPGEVKIGAIACLGDSAFLVLEHGEDEDNYDWIDLYRAVITAQTSDVTEASDVTGGGRLFQGGLKTLEQVGYIPGDSATLAASGITALRKTLVFGDVLDKTPWPNDKPEGMALINDTTVVLINDNDYGQSDENADGIPHRLSASDRLTHLMYINLKNGGIPAAIHPRARPGFRGGAAPIYSVARAAGGWNVHGPAAFRAVLTDTRGRIVAEAVAHDGAAFMLVPTRAGVYLLDLRHGDFRETRRVANW